MRIREKNIEKRNLETKNIQKNDSKITESLASMSSTMVDDCITGDDKSSDKPPPLSKTSQFFRRFRLSAKTRSKYREELRRSNSLLDLRATCDFLHEDAEDLTAVEVEKPTGGNASKNLDWLRRKKRAESEFNQKVDEETYVGNTLLKQKTRLRVRNANLNSLGESTPQKIILKPGNCKKSNSLPPQNLSSVKKSDSSGNVTRGLSLTRECSGEDRTDMEQVLYRAARIRRRRDRSKSGDVPLRSKAENHQSTDLDKKCSGSSSGSVIGSLGDQFGSITTLHSTTAPLSEDSFLAASCARTYNQKENCEQGSISTEYDPNSTGSQDIAESNSSGYWSRGGKETDVDDISLKGSLKDSQMNLPWKIPALNAQPAKKSYIVNRVEVMDTGKDVKKSPPTPHFYVALVAESQNGQKPDPVASGYRVRSGYTGRTRNRPAFTRSQSLTRDICSEDESISGQEAREIRRIASEIRDTRRRTKVSTRNTEARPAPVQPPVPIDDPSSKFIIQPDDIKVKEDIEKEQWNITIKISRSDSQETDSITQSIPKNKFISRNNMTTQTSPKSTSPVTVPSEPVKLAQPVIKAAITDRSSLAARFSRTDAMKYEMARKNSTGSGVTGSDQSCPYEAPLVVKWEQTSKAPVIKTSTDLHPRCPLAQRFNHTDFLTKKTVSHTEFLLNKTEIKRKDVMPDLPVRERPRFYQRQNKFKSVLSQWEDRINLSRTQSLDVINMGNHSAQNGSEKLNEKPVIKLPPLDSGPVGERNRLDTSNITKYSSDQAITEQKSSLLNRQFSSTRNCSLPRAFGNIGGMGRHSYRQGPIGWKAPTY